VIRIIFTILIFLVFREVFSQVQLTGELRNLEDDSPLFGINVLVKENLESETISFATSDGKGRFTVTFESQSDSLFLIFRSMVIQEISLKVANYSQALELKLEPSTVELEEYAVESIKNPISFKNDTLFYDVEALSNKSDRVIADVLRRLPGIEVSANGMISYQGKPLQKFYIDGLDLLEGKYNLANNNLPADAVSQVQILENHQPVRVLDSLVFSDRASLNLKLKKKNVWIGIINMGAGLSPFIWDVNLTPMLFRENFQVISSFQANNIGENIGNELKVLTVDQFMDKWKKEDISPWFGIKPVEAQGLRKERISFNNSQLATVNFLTKNQNELEMRTNISFLNDDLKQFGLNRTNFFVPGDTITIFEDLSNLFSEKSLNAELSLIKNVRKSYLKNLTSFQIKERNEIGNIIFNSQERRQSARLPLFEFGNEFKLLKPFKNRLINVESKTFYGSSSQVFKLNPGGFDEFLSQNSNQEGMIQNLNERRFYTNNNLGFSKRFLKHWTFTPKIGFILQQSAMESEVNSQEMLEPSNQRNDLFSNEMELWKFRTYLNSDFDFKSTKLNLSLKFPISYLNMAFEDRNFDFERNLSTALFEPSLNGGYIPFPKLTAYFSYQRVNEYKGLQQLHPGFIFRDYITIQQQLTEIPQELKDNYSMTLHYKEPIHSFFFTGGFNLSNSRMNTIIGRDVLETGELVLMARDFNNQLLSRSIYLKSSKYFPLIYSNLSLNINQTYRTGQQILQEEVFDFNFRVITPGLVWNYRPKSNFGLTLNSNVQWIQSEFGNTVVGNIQQYNNKIEMDIFPIENHLLRLSLDHFVNQINNQEVGFYNTFLDVVYRYKLPGSKTDLNLKIFNILGIDQFETFNASSYYLTSQSTLLRPRQFLISVSFSL
jgi:hypothetical protein